MGNPTNQDWVRLEVLILRRACTILRKQFRRRWKLSQKSDWIDSPSLGQKFVSGLGSQVYLSFGRLHKMTLEEGDVNNWDFNMLTRILQQVNFLPEQDIGIDPNMKLEFESENQRIEELISYGKKAIDYPTNIMDNKEFSNLWDHIEKILVSFGESEKELEELKRTESISEDDLVSLSGSEDSQIDQISLQEARRLKEEAKSVVNYDVENAINCLNSAIALHNLPEIELGALFASRSDAYLKKGAKFQKKEERSDWAYLALKDAKQALSLRPAWGLAYYRVGMAYVELNKLKKASKYLDKALDLEPNMEEIKVANNSCKIKLVELADDFAPDLKTFQTPVNTRIRPLPGGTRLSPEIMDRLDIIFFNEDEDNILGDVYKAHKLRDGIDTKQSYKEAALLYRKGVKSRNAEAMYNLALLKLEGKGIKQDVKGATDLLKRGAKQPHKLCQGNGTNFVSNVGVVESSFLLGFLASEGIGFPPQRDFFSASVWYQEASEHGSGPAAHNLGILHAKALGVQRNEKRALQLWKLGASRKAPESMFALAIHHAKEWDTGEARRWLELAISECSSNKNEVSSCNYNYENEYGNQEGGNSMWTPTEIQEFTTVLDTIDQWRGRIGQREISRWETNSGFSPGRIMNQNMNMKIRLVRMLHDLEGEKEKIEAIEEYFKHLQPKPVILPFPKAKIWVANLRKEMMLGHSVDDSNTRSSSSNDSVGGSVGGSVSEDSDTIFVEGKVKIK